MSSDEYEIFNSPAFGRKAKKLKKNEKQALDNAVLDILNDPEVGEQKTGDLSGIFVHKFKIGKKLVLLSYEIEDKEITLIFFGSHENFYRDLKAYRKA